MSDSEDQEQYVVVPADSRVKECLGPFSCAKEADKFADHYYAGQVAFRVMPVGMPPDEP